MLFWFFMMSSRVSTRNTTDPELPRLIKEACRDARVAELKAKGSQQMEAGAYADAARSFWSAIKLSPDDVMLAGLVQSAEHKAKAQPLKERAERACAAGDWLAAIGLYSRALEHLDEKDPAMAELLHSRDAAMASNRRAEEAKAEAKEKAKVEAEAKAEAKA